MADLEDGASLLDNDYDFDNKGNFLKGPDGYALGESVDYHDLDGRTDGSKTVIPRIIGKTDPKVEHFTEGHPGAKRRLTVMEKVQK
jgi:hypothetical protein